MQLFAEMRYAARRLAGSPGYSLGVFLTLALGLAGRFARVRRARAARGTGAADGGAPLRMRTVTT